MNLPPIRWRNLLPLFFILSGVIIPLLFLCYYNQRQEELKILKLTHSDSSPQEAIAQLDDRMNQFAIRLVLVGVPLLLGGLVVGWYFSYRSTRQIDQICSTLERVAAGELPDEIRLGKMATEEMSQLATILNAAFEHLGGAYKQQMRFTADASHELRTPLSVIITQTQMLLSRQRSLEEYREGLEICRRHAEGMRNLVNSLLDLARVDAAHLDLHFSDSNLSELVHDCARLVRPVADSRQITLTVDTQDAPCRIDEEKIRRVITNLLGNAIQYNLPCGKVHVTVRHERRTVILTVSDTGIGIPADHLPHIFERFYRVEKSRTRLHGGTGLGLAICQALVKAHHGTIEAESEPNKGSTFRVELPTTPKTELGAKYQDEEEEELPSALT